jgi:plastocyanin
MKKILVLGLILIGLFVVGCTSEQVTEVNEEVMEESMMEDELPMAKQELEEMEESELDEMEELEEELEELAPLVIESKKVKVQTSGLSFSPDEVTIQVGDSVEFTTGGIHNAVEVTEADWEAGKKSRWI